MTKPRTGPFPRTDKSEVCKAGLGATTEGRRALSKLCARYWPPLYAVARSRGHSVDKAGDLTQGFFTERILAKNDIATFDPGRGRFRSWLWACFKNYLANCRDSETSRVNGGGFAHVPFDTQDAERCYHAELARPLTPDALFDRSYAITLLRRAQDALKEEWADKGRGRQFEKLQGFTTYEDDQRYKDVAEDLGTSPEAVKTEICRLRGRFFALIRSEVAETVERPEDVDAELLDLLNALANEPTHPLQAGAQCVLGPQPARPLDGHSS